MNVSAPRESPSGVLASLRRFVRPPVPQERCELCNAAMPAKHAHVVEIARQRLTCACTACALLFSGRADGKFRRVPERVQLLRDFRLTDSVWDALQLPINLAFFLRCTPRACVLAFYPSPAGATEAAVPPEAWDMLARDNPVLGDFEPDVEALLVDRVGTERECYRTGIDECYKLVGLIRKNWRGFSGGSAVWEEIARFFAALKERSL